MRATSNASSSGRSSAIWFAASVLAAPLMILLHEVGHFLAMEAVGGENARIYYNQIGGSLTTRVEAGQSVTSLFADDPPRAIIAAGGLLVSILVPLAACFAVVVRGVRVTTVALGLTATLHFWLLAYTLLAFGEPSADVVNATTTIGCLGSQRQRRASRSPSPPPDFYSG